MTAIHRTASWGTVALLAGLLAAPVGQAQTTRYVTDSLRLEARSGPGTSFRIVRMLPSGAEVEVLEESDGYSRIRVGESRDGWILSRYLMPEPSARDRLKSLQAALESAEEKSEALARELARSRADLGTRAEERDNLGRQVAALESELTSLRDASASTLATMATNRTLSGQVDSLNLQLEAVTVQNRELKDRRTYHWFILGASVLFGGILLGLLLPRLRMPRRRRWSEF